MNQMPFEIQNGQIETFGEYPTTYWFVIQPCQFLQEITQRTDCKTLAESSQILNRVQVNTKVQSQFFNADTYHTNGEQLSRTFRSRLTLLNPTASIRYISELERHSVTYSGGVVYGDDFTNFFAEP